MFYYLQLMVKEGWKMKVGQSVDFSTLTPLPKVTVMTVGYLSVSAPEQAGGPPPERTVQKRK